MDVKTLVAPFTVSPGRQGVGDGVIRMGVAVGVSVGAAVGRGVGVGGASWATI